MQGLAFIFGLFQAIFSNLFRTQKTRRYSNCCKSNFSPLLPTLFYHKLKLILSVKLHYN